MDDSWVRKGRVVKLKMLVCSNGNEEVKLSGVPIEDVEDASTYMPLPLAHWHPRGRLPESSQALEKNISA